MSVTITESLDICGDTMVRERARRAGRVVLAEVVEVIQPKTSRLPCTVRLRSRQEVLRVRVGTVLQTLDGAVQGHVIAVSEDGPENTLIEVALSKGVRKGVRPEVGSVSDWADTVLVNTLVLRIQAYAAMREAASHLIYGRQILPP